MSSNEEKKYSPYEVAIAVLNKIQDMHRYRVVYKSNSSHEIEPGEEPNNEDAECPGYLSESESELSESDEKKEKKKKEKSEYEKNQPDHEKGMSEEEDAIHDEQEQDEDEMDSDIIEADEEQNEESKKDLINEAAKPKKEYKEKNSFEKSEGQEYKPELMRDKKDYHENAQKSDEDIAKYCKYCGSKKEIEKMGYSEDQKIDLKKPSKLENFIKKRKNKKMEKMLGIKDKQKQQSQMSPEKIESKPSEIKGY